MMMQSKIGSRFLGTRFPGSLALAAILAMPAASGFAQDAAPAAKPSAAKGPSDAQVEANVLKAFAGDNRLANQPINTSTVFGTVTLSGSVSDDAARDAAEQIASRTEGVKKVIDQLSVGAPQQADNDPAAGNSFPGTSIPAAQGGAIVARGQNGNPDNGNVGPDAQAVQQGQAALQEGNDPSGQYAQQPQFSQQPQSGQPQYGQQPQYGDPNGYPQANGGYPPQGQQQGRLYRRDYERQMANGGYGQQQQGYPQQQYAAPQGQPGGQAVVVPQGSVLAVRINHWLSSGDAAPGSTFSAFVSNDVVAGGVIAIPRGATVEGEVIDAKGAGALKGRGELTLALTTLELGGQRIPLQSEPFTVNGRDKTAQSINSTIIGAGVGALLGAAIGRGTGAAIGAGVGGAAGLGASAASNGGQANIPAEALLHFRLTTPVQVVTVSEVEMQRLGGYAGPASAYRSAPPAYARPYPATVGIYAYPAPYPYRYYRRGGYYRGGYWY
jgi:hypothetical protein